MVTALEIVQTRPQKKLRLKLLADSKEEKLPTKVKEIEGMSGEEEVDKGSICITPAMDVCIMGNNGKWGEWL